MTNTAHVFFCRKPYFEKKYYMDDFLVKGKLITLMEMNSDQNMSQILTPS